MMVLEKGGMFLISEVPLYLHVAASGFRGSLKRIQLTFIWTTANWPRGTTSRGGFRREIGPPRDGHARLGTDGPASGRPDQPHEETFLQLDGVSAVPLSCAIRVQSRSLVTGVPRS
jgi:hypothetical protein